MIERITGQLVENSPTYCIVDCHGVGLGLHISLNTFQFLERQPKNNPIQLITYLHVREDAMQLFGFADKSEKELFLLLNSVSGVGPRLAIAILSGYATDDLRRAIANEDVGTLTRIPGVGKKTAQRLVLELREKVGKSIPDSALAELAEVSHQSSRIVDEAIKALGELGFKTKDAQSAVEKVLKQANQQLSLEDLVVKALREL